MLYKNHRFQINIDNYEQYVSDLAGCDYNQSTLGSYIRYPE